MVKKKVAKKRVVKKLKVLPRKMSALIRIALADIRKAEKSDKFVVDMGTWYQPGKELVCKISDDSDEIIVSARKVCVACAAGSVMAFSLGLGANSLADSENGLLNSDENGEQLNAINDLRRGAITGAAEGLGLIDYNVVNSKKGSFEFFRRLNTNIPEYSMLDPEPFHRAMTTLQAKLVKAGL